MPFDDDSASSLSVTVMGISFANPLGLAAGYDRTGEIVPSLLEYGFGHMEVGTTTPATWRAIPLDIVRSATRLGFNIGSAEPGLDDQVIEDYATMLRQTYGLSDYVVANLSAPLLQREGNMPGIERLVERLAETRDALAADKGHRVPLLIKLEAGPPGSAFPAAITALRASGLDGVTLVSDRLDRIKEISSYLDGLTCISVGGVRSAEDVKARISAGASLVQMHSAFADVGPEIVEDILQGLATQS